MLRLCDDQRGVSNIAQRIIGEQNYTLGKWLLCVERRCRYGEGAELYSDAGEVDQKSECMREIDHWLVGREPFGYQLQAGDDLENLRFLGLTH